MVSRKLFRCLAACCCGAVTVSAFVAAPHRQTPRKKQSTKMQATSAFEVAKNGAIGVWLFGGLVPALAAVNVYAVKKATTERPDDFVETTRTDAMPLASLGAADVVSATDVGTVLQKLDRGLPAFEPLSKALGGKTGSGPLYLSKTNFKAWSRSLSVGDAALDSIFDAWARGSGVAAKTQVDASLRQWRTSVGDFDLGAVDRAIFAGRVTVLLGFAGLAAIDAVVLLAFAFALKSAFSSS